VSVFRHILRRLSRAPMFTATAVVTLAIGIAANTSIFSVVSGVLLKPLPYPEADRLVGVWQTAPGLNLRNLNASPATYFTYREENRTLEDIGLWRLDSVSITGLAEPEQVRALMVTDGTLPILRVRPAFGRWFTKQDDSPGSAETAMLSHGYWQRRFGGDRSVIGRRLIADGRAREIIGVMPQDFRFSSVRPEIILPFQLNRAKVVIGEFSYQALARLKPGVTVQEANADVARMLPMLSQKFPPAPGMSLAMFNDARLGPNLRPFKDDVIGDVGRVLWVLMGTVAVVLLIACANIANLLLVRMDGRQQEFAIRAAMGANWRQIAREMLAESVTLGVLGGLGGILLSYGALRLLVRFGPSGLPRLEEISIDGVVLAFSIIISVLSGVLFGMVPVLKFGGPRVAVALRSGGRTMSEGRERHRARGALVVVQVALALVLLISSGLMVRSLYSLRDVRPGFQQPDQVLTLRISIPTAQTPEPERVLRMFNDMVDKISAIPSVTSVALANSVTMDGNNNNDPIFAEDRAYGDSQIPPLRRYKHIMPGVFQTLRNPIIAGRDLTWTDIYQAREVVLVSENLAGELWGSATAALGKRVRENPKGTWREIVGVVGNEHDNGVHERPPTIVYWPAHVRNFWGSDVSVRRSMAIIVRSNRTGSSGFLQDVQRAIWSVNPDLPIANVRTLRQIYDTSMARTSFTAVMLSIAAGTALLLGIIGIYGVISYSISQRTREIGIRMALGASQGNVRRLFVRHGLALAVIGIVCGIAASVPLTRLMSSLLYGTSPFDPLTYGTVAMALISVAVLAAYLPARRATAIQPLEALRFE
jgi:putative ABC transport system permease protein